MLVPFFPIWSIFLLPPAIFPSLLLLPSSFWLQISLCQVNPVAPLTSIQRNLWVQNGCKLCRFAPGVLQNEMPSGRARNASRSQIRLGGMCFLVTTRMEIALGEAKVNIAPASCSLQILSKSEITKIYYLICLQLLFEACWKFGIAGYDTKAGTPDEGEDDAILVLLQHRYMTGL